MRHLRRTYHLLAVALVAMALLSCSTQKNTGASRAFHAMKTRYNIYFNGNTSFEEGEKATRDANKDNYAELLPLYPVSNHEAAKAANSQMDRTIEKCRKCIKLHSIKAKPKINTKKRNDPKYKAWLTHEEFNEAIDDAWLLLGKAEFSKGDFEGAIGTFRYVINHFGYDKDVVAQCQLWIVRSYAELGWLYEAEDLLSKVSVDDLSRRHAPLYSAVSADLKCKTENYRDAIPFVKLALPEERRDGNRPRFQYALGQLYEMTGERQKAVDAYTKVIRMNPQWEMDFNARLRRYTLSDNPKYAVRELEKMAKRFKFKDKLDQIYGAIGNVYLAAADTAQALEYYQKAITEATQAGPEKAQVLITAADIYYQRREYAEAAPCYSEASNIISAEHDDYLRVRRLSETLQQLVTEYDVVTLQDSLQHLATLPEQERLAVVEKVIEQLVEQEKRDKEKAEQEARDQQNQVGQLRSVNTQNMLGGGGGAAEWYFYNTQLVRSGQQTFRQKWGQRQLEDDWRRVSKSFSTMFETDEPLANADTLTTDTLGTKRTLVTDTHDPQYYLQQIPTTPQELAASDSLIANAMYNMIFIYQDQIEDEQMAQQTADEFCERFPEDPRILDLYYSQYLRALKHNDTATADTYRQLIVSRYPDSKEARVVADPNYFSRMQHMAAEQDSLFEATYRAFRNAGYDTVMLNTDYAEQEYPLSPLMPKFLFLNSIAEAKTKGQPAFVGRLRELVDRYPESDVASMAKDMLAMMNEGLEAQKNTDLNTLADKRSESDTDVDSTLVNRDFSDELKVPTQVILIVRGDQQQVGNLLYEVALFNFSQFLIKDFDLKTEIPFKLHTDDNVFERTEQQTLGAVEVLGFESYTEGQWYVKLLNGNDAVRQLLQSLDADIVVISEENLKLLQNTHTLQQYRDFEKQTF